MDDNLTDEQRAQQVRGWLSENGWYLLAGLALGLAALFGWNQWKTSGDIRGEKASALYDELLVAVRVERTARAEELAVELGKDFAGSPYTDQARLAMARLKMDGSQPAEAARYLELVVRESSRADIVNIARLRLARVLIHQEKFDEALKVLTPPKDSAFRGRYHEVRGDTYYAMGRADEAAVEYAAALQDAADGGIDPAFIQAKLTDVGRADPAPAAAPPAPAAN